MSDAVLKCRKCGKILGTVRNVKGASELICNNCKTVNLYWITDNKETATASKERQLIFT